MGQQLRDTALSNLLVHLGEFARDHDLPPCELEFGIGEQGLQPAR